jgi:hypothetical protein
MAKKTGRSPNKRDRNKSKRWSARGGTAFFGIVFMVLKGIEYRKDWIDHLVPVLNFQWHEPNPSPVHVRCGAATARRYLTIKSK